MLQIMKASHTCLPAGFSDVFRMIILYVVRLYYETSKFETPNHVNPKYATPKIYKAELWYYKSYRIASNLYFIPKKNTVIKAESRFLKSM